MIGQESRPGLGEWSRPWDVRLIAELRGRRGWTQEVLAERSGLSVRTIRNLELGRIQNPRQSSLDLLAEALGMAAERQLPDPAAHARWRGPQPPATVVVGSRSDQELLVHAVRANRLTTLFGPGGVGKTRRALSIAAEVGPARRHGVVVVELGDLAPERGPAESRAAAVLHRVRQHLAPGPGSAPDDRDVDALVVLDNAEHVPDGVTTAVKELLGAFPRVHLLVTSRRRLTERMGVNREVRPLCHEHATELVLRHVGDDAHAVADLAEDPAAVAELCRRLGGLPRYLEFAAERMRAIPVRHLLRHGPAAEMLWSNDHALLPHQRSVADGIRWNLGLLDDAHRALLARIVGTRAHRFTLDHSALSHPALAGLGPAAADPLRLLPDLLELSVVLADPEDRYRYRLSPYVAEVVGASGHESAPTGRQASAGLIA